MQIDLNINDDNSVFLENVRFIPGEYIFSEQNGNYSLKLFKNNQEIFSNNYLIIFESTAHFAQTEKDSILFSFILPRKEFDQIILFREDIKIFEEYMDQKMFCNFDGVCNNFENAISCPSDCPPDQKDGICVSQKDGVCDPDCPIGIDPDCFIINEKNFVQESKEIVSKDKIIQSPKEETNFFPIIIFFLGLIVFIIFIIISKYYLNKK